MELRSKVYGAAKAMHRMRLEAAAMAEAPILRNTWLFAIANRAEKSTPQEDDYRIFRLPREDDAPADNGIAPATAAALLSLANEGLCPAYMLSAWQEVQRVANQAPVKCPEVRALVSDCGKVTVIAPTFTHGNIRGGLVGTGEPVSGTYTLRDVDRKFLTYRVTIPGRRSAGWVEASLLLLAAP
jgi:hypothetical protein